MRKILVVEDDHLIAELERDYLEASEYEVEIAKDGYEGVRLSNENTYALIVLDVMLPGVSGFDICREIRKKKNVPVIMVTAKKTDVDKIRGLGLGADDYIIKPFSPTELVARVQAHIRIHERLLGEAGTGAVQHQENCIDLGTLKIYPLSRRVIANGKEVSMANKEFELLMFLAQNPNIVFSRDTLFDRIWGMEALGDTDTVTVHVNRIRGKIEEDPSNPRYIETIWGAGYRFNVV